MSTAEHGRKATARQHRHGGSRLLRRVAALAVTAAGLVAATAHPAAAAPLPPTLAKSFAAPSVPVGTTTTLTFTVVNPNLADALTRIAFSDTLPAGLVVATPPGTGGTCTGTVVANQGGPLIILTGAVLAPASACTLTVNILAQTTGVKNNTTSAVTSNESGPGPGAAASLTVTTGAPPACTIVGTSATDVLVGTAGNDVICGLGGNDIISGGAGNDTIYGGPGVDIITAGSGSDTVYGEDGNDVIDVRDGVGGNDTANGGTGLDMCTIDTGDTRISCP